MSTEGNPPVGEGVARSPESLGRALERFPPFRWSISLLQRMGFSGRTAVIAVPYLWLLLFFLVPFIFVLKISLAEALIARPPYSPLFERGEEAYWTIRLNFENFLFLLEDDLYWKAYLNSAKIALVSTAACLVIGYPVAYGIARSDPAYRNTLLMLIILPFWTSFLLRVYAWIGILKNNGLVNNVLMGIGVIDEPIVMMQTDFAVYVGIVFSYVPFMILALYANLERLDTTLLEAAADLGCRPMKAFLRITHQMGVHGVDCGCGSSVAEPIALKIDGFIARVE